MSNTSEIIYSHKLPIGTFKVYLENPELSGIEENLFKVTQTHSSDIVQLQSSTIDHLKNIKEKKADGLMLDFSQWGPDLPKLCVVTADCLPVALCGKKGVALVHAGWKGLAQNILEHSILSDLEIYYAFIGPSIGPCCYQVQSNFKHYFPKSSNFIARHDKTYFDLWSQAKDQLQSHYHRHKIKIDMSERCTHCGTGDKGHKFHSFRREQNTNRNWNIWKL